MPGQFQKGVYGNARYHIRPEDGTGADWRLILESLYRAGFNIADEQLDDNARRKSCGASTRGGSAPDGWLRGRFRRKSFIRKNGP